MLGFTATFCQAWHEGLPGAFSMYYINKYRMSVARSCITDSFDEPGGIGKSGGSKPGTLRQIHNKRPIPTNRCWMQKKNLPSFDSGYIYIYMYQNRMSNPNNYLDSFTMPMKISCKKIRSSIPFVICLLGACSQKKHSLPDGSFRSPMPQTSSQQWAVAAVSVPQWQYGVYLLVN